MYEVIAAGLLALLLFAYLFYALLWPERLN